MNNVRKNFTNLVNRILNEELERANAIGTKSVSRVPEMDANGIYVNKDIKRPDKDSIVKSLKSKELMISELSKEIEGIIEKAVSINWDDHDDLMVSAKDLKYIRISPRWTDYFVIEMFTRNEDRIWITGQTWDQVKEFVKTNLKNVSEESVATEKAFDKVTQNRKDQTPSPDKGMPQKDKPKIKPLTNEPQKNKSKNKEKDYVEDLVKQIKDLPNQPMSAVDDFKKLIDYKVKDPVRLRKRVPNKTLKIKMK